MKPKIGWLFHDWDVNAYRQENDLYGAIGYYRAIKPAQVLRKWFDIDVIGAEIQKWGGVDQRYGRLGREYDLIISKNLRTGLDASNLLATVKHFKKKLIVDIDDNFLAVREDNPAFKVYKEGEIARGVTGAFGILTCYIFCRISF